MARSFLVGLSHEFPDLSGASLVVFCHKADLYKDLNLPSNFQFYEIEASRKSWIARIFYEYLWFYWWSSMTSVDDWISLHDITPNVISKRRIVYCHNPAPFYRGASLWQYDRSFELFRNWYKYLYLINIRYNHLVIVQQQWLREAFVKEFKIASSQVIVAYPRPIVSAGHQEFEDAPLGPLTICYPAVPRPFKNFEVLLKAMRLVADLPLKLILTFSGKENAYSTAIQHDVKQMENVELVGYLTHDEMRALYGRSKMMIFPSKLETWGLPISEFAQFGRPIIAADLQYAHEAVGTYEKVSFFPPDDFEKLAGILRSILTDPAYKFDGNVRLNVGEPHAVGWEMLAQKIASAKTATESPVI